MNYKIGDIVLVSEGVRKEVNHHLFVIIDDDGKAVSIDYFGFVISSRIDKSKENSEFKYNEIIKKDEANNLKTDSIVKCDQLMKIPAENIDKRIGTVSADDLIKFLNSFNIYLENSK